jgi:hypothetical protein
VSPRDLLRKPFLLVLGVATLLLTWRLGAVYLWQDEAATAVLAERLFTHGKPLAYDGRNMITMDSFVDEDEATIGRRTGDADAAFRYLVERHDFKPDGAWIGQPWGQFVAAGASLAAFGHGTVAARLPFALAAIATAALLYLLARRIFASESIALLSVALLLANAPWIQHARQCRYYALSSLGLLGTVAAFVHWRRGGRFGAPLFVLVGWLYFQCDFGSCLPAFAVLAVIAAVSAWPRIGSTALTFACLGAAIAPFAWYYEILGRVRTPIETWDQRLGLNASNLNQYVIAAPVLIVGAWLLVCRRATLDASRRHVLWAAAGIVLVMVVWVPAVAPLAFHRYVVQLTPLAALLAAWTVCEVAALAVPRDEVKRVALGVVLGGVLLGTGIFSAPLAFALGKKLDAVAVLGRPELPALIDEIFEGRLDPNRMVIEALAPRLRPDDEILVNYEDVPWMFYTRARIRGGVAAFRAEERGSPPRFFVLRQTVPFVHWDVFNREVARHEWRQIRTGAPDLPFGNNPDPIWLPYPVSTAEVLVGERIGPAK